jgi:single-strand DNA-binding protein
MAKGMNTQIVAGKATKVETREVNGKQKLRITIQGFPFFVIAFDAQVSEGDTVFVQGRVQTRSYEKDGETRYITEVIARYIVNLAEKAGNVTVAIGNLGRDPEMRFTSTGKAVTGFSVAANVFGADDPEWFNITAWEKLGEVCNQYLSKGDRVAIAGRLNLDSWEDDAGQRHYRTKLTANELLMLGGKGGNGGGSNGGSYDAEPEPSLEEIEDIPF